MHLRRLPDSSGANANLQVSRYMVTIRGSVDLDAALGRPDVNAALRRLAQDPEDRRRRDDVIAELIAVPCPTRFATTIFDLSTARAGGDEAFLDGLLVIRNQGIQIAEQGLRPHHLTYVTTPTAEATRLLETNPRLAAALVNHLCPVPSAVGDGEHLADLLREAIVDRDRPTRPPGLPPRGPGTVLRIEHLNGDRSGSQNVDIVQHLPGTEPPQTSSPRAEPESESESSGQHESGPVNGSPPPIDAADRILELDPRTIDLHPSLGKYLAALSDHIGYEVGTRAEPEKPAPAPDDDERWLDDLNEPPYSEYPERDDDHDLGFGIAGR